jgi:serine/threonine-protein kinase HipA
MNGEFVGRWWSTRSGEGRLEYDQAWRQSRIGRPLSLSLPFGADHTALRGDVVERWFENLLPDSDIIRRRLGATHQVDARDAHALLGAIGRDCVGALQLCPDDEPPSRVDTITYHPLTEGEVAAHLLRVVSPLPFGSPDASTRDFRISLAGAQEKTALLWHDGGWCVPTGATPTTHILKLPMGQVGAMQADFRSSVENEWLCLTLLRAMGLPTAESRIAHFAGESGVVKALVVTRFDRRRDTDATRDWIVRLPQEDCCQATGTAADRKYESEGGPGIPRILTLLENSDRSQHDMRTFTLTQLAFWLLAAPDGHAKNFSIFLRASGRYRLTPIYDVLSAWPIVGKGPQELHVRDVQLAMALRGKKPHRRLDSIHVTHWRALAERAGVSDLFESMVAMVDAIPATLALVEPQLPADFPALVWERIRDGLLAQRERFQAAMVARDSA